jgi:hypothetical protein
VSVEAYASLLDRSGHRVVRTAGGVWWYDAHPHWYQALPLHVELAPTPDDTHAVRAHGAWVLRYTCPVEVGAATYVSVCDDAAYGLETLSSTARRATRRGMENCTVRQVSFTDLERDGGLELSRSTLERQGRAVTADHDAYWRRHYAAAAASDVAECWGAFVRDRLAAFLIAVTIGDAVYLTVLRSASEHLSDYPNNAVVHSFTADALARPGVTTASWGLESLLPSLGGLERFKEGMGFERRCIGQRIETASWMRPALRGPAAWAVRGLATRDRGGHTIARAAATVRVCAQQPPRHGTDP